MVTISTDEQALSVALALYITTQSERHAELCITLAKAYAEDLDDASIRRAQNAGMDMVLDALNDRAQKY